MSAKEAYVEVADRLRTMILETELRAGDRLPSEMALAEQFAVGRSTIREALRILASQNLLVTSRGVTGGTSIAELKPSDVADALRDHLTLLTATSSIVRGDEDQAAAQMADHLEHVRLTYEGKTPAKRRRG
jgi:GntR family transcriptional regulator, transcriptional repressor for pyruvate dehydrogenase complex